MKTLITGHRGFIGSHLMDELHDTDGYDLLEGEDITDRLRLYNTFERGGYDTVLHLAALPSVRRGQLFPNEMILTNVTGTQNVIEMCQKFDIKRFVFFSSSSVLGGNTDPYKGLAEDAPYKPISMYGITKVAGELLTRNSGLEYVIIRPFSVYGKDGRRDMVVYRWIESIKKKKPVPFYGDGTAQRGYTNVDELVRAVAKIATADWKLWRACKNNTFHLGGAEIISTKDLYEIFEDYCYKHKLTLGMENIPMMKGDITTSFADVDKAKSILGFEPQQIFRETIMEILKEELWTQDHKNKKLTVSKETYVKKKEAG